VASGEIQPHFVGGLALPFASETNARKNSNQREALAQPR
jgi:hypothetical protein